MTKFGVDQTGNIPPLWWRRFERSVMVGLAPALILLVNKVVADAEQLAHITSYIGFGLGIIKTIGIFMGSETEYPKEETPAAQDVVVDDLHIEKE